VVPRRARARSTALGRIWHAARRARVICIRLDIAEEKAAPREERASLPKLQAAGKEGVTIFLRDLSARRNLEHDPERRNCVLSTRRETSIEAVLPVDVNARISDLRIRIFIYGSGTIHCSPRKIATLPINALKIDGSFVLGMMWHERRRALSPR